MFLHWFVIVLLVFPPKLIICNIIIKIREKHIVATETSGVAFCVNKQQIFFFLVLQKGELLRHQGKKCLCTCRYNERPKEPKGEAL